MGRGANPPQPAPARRPRGGRGEPYGDDVVARARELVEETRLTQKQIGARVGVSHMTICRWARAGAWRRPPGCARPFDQQSDSLRAMTRYNARTRPWRTLAEAEALVASSTPCDLDGMERSLALVLEARELHAQGIGPKRRRE